MSDADADFGLDDTEQGREELEGLVQGALKTFQEATDRAEAAEARCKRLERLLAGVLAATGNYRPDLDCVVMKHWANQETAIREALSDTAQQETGDG